MSHGEYALVDRVFGGTLPHRFRILVTDGAGLDGRAFTVPSSLIGTFLGTEELLANVTGGLSVSMNLGFLMNVGEDFAGLTTTAKDVLVHETAHVWQGHNSALPMAYVFSSIVNQCFRSDAYGYSPGKNWKSYNAEQQASIVEDWFRSGESTSSSLYRYIANHVRKGDA
jgi:hypothetical protein